MTLRLIARGCSTQGGPTLLSVEEARSRIIDEIRLPSRMRIELGDALGRALAEDILAARAHPRAAVAAMDGYALRSADVLSLPVKLKKIGHVQSWSEIRREDLGRRMCKNF
jgi:molybdopterin biosynthesis enzyme